MGRVKNEQMKLTDFFDTCTNSGNPKVDSMIFGWAWSCSWLFSSGDP